MYVSRPLLLTLCFLLEHTQASLFQAHGKNVPMAIMLWAFPNVTQRAYDVLIQNGSALDAVERALTFAEDLTCHGHPDEDREVTFDALLMEGKNLSVGAVASLRRVRNPTGVARLVMNHTTHSILSCSQATEFALRMGRFEEPLNTTVSDEEWTKWHNYNNCQPNFYANVDPDPKIHCGPYFKIPRDRLNPNDTDDPNYEPPPPVPEDPARDCHPGHPGKPCIPCKKCHCECHSSSSTTTECDDIPSTTECDDIPSTKECDDIPSTTECGDILSTSECDDFSSTTSNVMPEEQEKSPCEDPGGVQARHRAASRLFRTKQPPASLRRNHYCRRRKDILQKIKEKYKSALNHHRYKGRHHGQSKYQDEESCEEKKKEKSQDDKHDTCCGQRPLGRCQAHPSKKCENKCKQSHIICTCPDDDDDDDDEEDGIVRMPKEVVEPDSVALLVLDRNRSLAGGATSSGPRFRIPGRVAEAVLPGAAVYVDDDVGAAAASGDGDLLVRFLPGVLAVEAMRRGWRPDAAARIALTRICKRYPCFKGAVVAINLEGDHGAACHGYKKMTYTYTRKGNLDKVQVVPYKCFKLNSKS
ncbi:hypothetical protein JYU34_009258 [Plutella xylostella]|uniref:Uncharacterized protein n=1 Tax=Plutella xylostella TaxID=51655 RepID=A0ABQ7QJ13_PLUXY|nr:hypothetical protein JYU34_009258 [Plutella xylostella]